MNNLRPTFKCHGGKKYLREYIISNFPTNYENMPFFEACIGGGSIILNKNASVKETINDADPDVFNIYQHLINHPKEFITRLQSIAYTEENFIWAKNYVKAQDLESAVAELCVRRMSRGGLKKHFSWSQRLRGGQPGDVNAFQTFKEHLSDIALRLREVQVENLDIKEFIQKYDQPNFFHYLDPPYMLSTRRATKAYDKEMTDKEHGELCDLIMSVKSKVLISGYQSPLYLKKLKEWNFSSVPVVNHSGQTKTKEMRVECTWRNY